MLITLGISFFTQTISVRAMLGNTHTADVLIRFINEIVLKSPAGQYYIDLSWKHTDDLNRIYIDTPDYIEHREKLIHLIQMFTPGMEALLDGQGDTALITKEQINLLKDELSWIASVAGQPLREDIEKEQQRFPLDNFIGMTMSEALEYVNSTWKPNTLAGLPATPAIISTAVIPICLIGIDVSCQEKPLLTSDSQWAYYVHDGIYFEYPGDWQVQHISYAEIDEFTIFRESASIEEGNIRLVDFTFLDLQNAPIENWDQALPFLLSQRGCSDRPWETIHKPSFQGFECFWKDSDSPTGNFRFFLYNENQQIGIDLRANVLDDRLLETTNDLNAIKKIFPNIEHIIESIRMSKP
ncbi:MAG: hypothetical protein H7Y59_05650 [Anaerolineales bacterium]|nr:hypothetical protein [Anaerolineales bacterium]